MKKNFKKTAIIDLEATCWDHHPPKGQTNEIIEIGLCFFDNHTFEITDKKSIIIKPHRSEISDFCVELTGITQNLVDKEGISYREACELLLDEYDLRRYPWASWGDYDRNMFEKECRQKKVQSPVSKRHLNAKTLFSIKHKLNKELGMARALAHLNLKLEGNHHRGADDAWNIAKLFRSCFA